MSFEPSDEKVIHVMNDMGNGYKGKCGDGVNRIQSFKILKAVQ